MYNLTNIYKTPKLREDLLSDCCKTVVEIKGDNGSEGFAARRWWGRCTSCSKEGWVGKHVPSKHPHLPTTVVYGAAS